MNDSGFRKWEKFENHYNEKFISFFENEDPNSIKNSNFQVTEKIDGANFSMIFSPFEPPVYCKRSGKINGDFFNYQRLFEDQEYIEFVKEVQNAVDNMGEIKLQFVGELYGAGIQKRIAYGNKRYWRWFGIYETFVGVPAELAHIRKRIRI